MWRARSNLARRSIFVSPTRAIFPNYLFHVCLEIATPNGSAKCRASNTPSNPRRGRAGSNLRASNSNAGGIIFRPRQCACWNGDTTSAHQHCSRACCSNAGSSHPRAGISSSPSVSSASMLNHPNTRGGRLHFTSPEN